MPLEVKEAPVEELRTRALGLISLMDIIDQQKANLDEEKSKLLTQVQEIETELHERIMRDIAARA